ncbi:MAG: sulfatase-like hydrolase/transferase, partial [Clostridia bacterium]
MEKRPNILFILSDQHSPHVLGCAGNRDIRTPNLDSLASEGVVLDNMYCQNPLCVPSRASLITGRYSRNTGIYDNMHIMEANTTTLPGVLSANGYRTCLIGKSHFNGEQYHGYMQRPYGDLYGQGHQPDPGRRPEFGINGLGDVLANSGPSEMPIELTQTEICVAEACK